MSQAKDLKLPRQHMPSAMRKWLSDVYISLFSTFLSLFSLIHWFPPMCLL